MNLFYKPSNLISCIPKESNHPPNTTKQWPLAIKAQLSKLSSNEKI